MNARDGKQAVCSRASRPKILGLVLAAALASTACGSRLEQGEREAALMKVSSRGPSAGAGAAPGQASAATDASSAVTDAASTDLGAAPAGDL
ncbi:MAG TPA: hypothetical protein VI854_00135, partial [Acidimicrobiia bacterium]|nr:hypothetical protein [Acidimicrobiia bacterium]